MMMAARKNKGTKDKPWPQVVRDRIRAGMLEVRLMDHALGKVDMTTTQVAAAKVLIDKILPNLTEHDASMTIGLSDPMTELLEYIVNQPGNRLMAPIDVTPSD